jgi:hypothetical protein
LFFVADFAVFFAGIVPVSTTNGRCVEPQADSVAAAQRILNFHNPFTTVSASIADLIAVNFSAVRAV